MQVKKWRLWYTPSQSQLANETLHGKARQFTEQLRFHMSRNLRIEKILIVAGAKE